MKKMKKKLSLALVLFFVFALTSTSMAFEWDCNLDGHLYNSFTEEFTQVSYPGMCSSDEDCIITSYYEATDYKCAVCYKQGPTDIEVVDREHSINH